MATFVSSTNSVHYLTFAFYQLDMERVERGGNRASPSQTIQAAGLLDCAGSCSVHPDCKSFQCNPRSGLCSLYPETTPSAGTPDIAGGEKYYLLVQDQTDISEHRNCSVNIHFTKDRPKCEVGWPFDPKKNKCVQVCERYGKGVTTYVGVSIVGNNDELIRSLTLKECENKCVTWKPFICKSFDYGKEGNFSFLPYACFLSKKGYFEVPGADRWKGNLLWTLGVRHCEP